MTGFRVHALHPALLAHVRATDVDTSGNPVEHLTGITGPLRCCLRSAREDEKVILFGGHPANEVKGYDVFTDVLKELSSRGVKVRELVLAARNQPRGEVPLKFDAADVLLFTSRKGAEGSPSVLKEAAVMGLPIVKVPALLKISASFAPAEPKITEP
jgi:glycosyltransferase involved in cell wall biosynthesis